VNRTFLFSLTSAAVITASCGGKVLVDGLGPNGPEGTGGAGGAGGAMTTGSHGDSSVISTSNVVGSAGSTGPGQASSGTGPPCDPKYHCAEAITPPGNPQFLCPGSMSSNLYQTLLKCTCGGPCAASCASSVCIGMMASGSCIMCEQ